MKCSKFHRHLKARAAKAGLPLSDYLRGEVRLAPERATLEQLCARLEQRFMVAPNVTPAEAMRRERDSR